MRSPDRKLRNLFRIFSAIICGVFSFSAIASTNLSVWVFPGASGRLISQPTATGDRILDYSDIGYGGGKIPLPSTNVVPVKIVVQPVAGDNVSNIQAAINYVSGLAVDTNGFRGAVYLSNGVYNVGSQIKISKSGVVLRGAGSFTNGSGTVLYATATNAQSVLIEVTGSGSASTISGTTHNITNNYVPVGARSFWVNSAGGLSVGQNVYVERIATSNWIHDLGMDLLGPPPDVPWTPSGYNMNMERTITHIEGNHIFVDSPITCAIDAVRYTNGTIRAFTWTSRITNCGVEHIFAQSWYNGNSTNEYHQQSFIQFDRVVNGWVRDVADLHFVLYCVSINDDNRFITVQDSASYDPISIITGGRRYAFNINGSEDVLIKNCYTRNDRHQFVTESVTIGPNAFVDGSSDSAHAEAGPHQRWSSGVLWDNITVHGGNNDIQNAGNYGTGHGWEGANCVIWNNVASGFILQNPPLAQNWLIGSVGPIQTGTAWNIGNTNMPHAAGNYDSSGSSAKNVFPDSIYFNQWQDRLSVPNTQPRDYWLGGFGQFTNNPAGGVRVTLDSTWSNAVKTISSGQPLDNFDVVTNNHWVPFTFNFTLAANERVVAATLALSMKATNSANSDVLYLGSTTNNFSFSSLNWLPIATGTNITVRVLDLVNQLNSLTNGQLNVAVQGDIGVDWAMLELQVAPSTAVTTSTLMPIADATVRGGTSAGSNFGTATTLTVRQDASANNQQQSFLKWDLSSVSGKIYQARVVLTPVSVGSNNIEQGVMVTASNNWTENAVTWNSRPSGVERFATWIPSIGGTVSFDVTPQVLDAMQNDKQLSLELFSIGTNSVDYASRENASSSSRPQLIISQPGIGPTISGIANQSILPNTSAGPIAFTISGDTNSIVLSGDSSNPDLIPDSNIVFGGSGTNRSVTLTPLANQTGGATITISVNDPGGLSASTSFTLTVSTHSPTTLVWNGTNNVSANTNWSSANNWSPTYAPEYADNVKFFDAGASGIAVSNVNNFIAFDTTIASLQFGNTNGNHMTLIGDGNTLTISGGLTAGTETDNGNAQVVSANITGGSGTLNLNNSSANLTVRQGSANSGSQRATLDMSGLGEFDATINQISIGIAGVNRPAGTLYLARTNNVTLSSSPGIYMADSGSNGGAQSILYFGINNQIYADSITIGSQKSSAAIAFAPYFTNQNPTLYLRSASGDRMAQWLVGDNSKQGTSGSSCSGTVDFSGGSVDAQVDAIYLGKGQTSTGAGSATGTLTLNAGTLDVNTLEAGYQNSSTPGSVVTGTVNVNGTATLNVNTTLRLARAINTSSNFPVGNLNVNGGTVSGTGRIVAGGGTSSINATGGTFAVASIGSLSAPLTKLALTNSTLQFSVAAGVTNCATTNLICGGSSNVISILSLPGGAAQYVLIQYSGVIGGAGYNFTLGTIPMGAQGYLSNNVANASVDLVVTNYTIPDSFLTWDGDFSGGWDTETANWKNNIAGDLYYIDGNDVVFNDSASGATNVNITDIFAPNSVTVSNNVKNFTFQGDGNLTGAMMLTKSGGGSLTLVNTGNNDFSGGVAIFAGNLIVGDGTTNGNLPSVGDISDNGSLTFNRSDSVAVTGIISGNGSLTNNGSGTLTLSATNTYTGTTVVNSGTLALAGGNSPNSGLYQNSSIIINNGTLQLNTDNSLTGNGSSNAVPITINAGGILTGLASADSGAGTSTHIRGLLTLNGGTLAMDGTQSQPKYGTWNLDGGVATAGGTNTSTISALNVVPSQTGGTIFNVIDGATASGIDLNITGTLTNCSTLHDTGVIKNGNGTLLFSGLNAYAGSTTINAGALIVNGAIGSSDVAVNSSGTLAGTGSIGGSVTVNLGGTISPGADNLIGQLTVASNVTLNGTVQMKLNKASVTNDALSVGSALTYGGSLILTNLSGTLTTNDNFKLFNAATYSGAFTNISPVIPGINLAWNTNTLVIDGTLRITNAPTPPPRFAGMTANGTSLTLTITNGPAGYPFEILTSTNVALPLAQWNAVATNYFDSNGNFSMTNSIVSPGPQAFYLLQLR